MDGRRWDMYLMGILVEEWQHQVHDSARASSRENSQEVRA